MSSSVPITLVADSAGFAALVLIAASSVAMVYRGRMLLRGVKLTTLRWIHLSLASGAAVALALHVSLFIGFPPTAGVLLGYAAFAAALVVWFTGSSIVERFRDSLVYHGQLTIATLALVLIHASVASVAMSPFAPFVLSSVAFVALINGVHHLSKLGGALR